jgi:hypothetical protein
MSILSLIDGLDLGSVLHYKPGQGERFTVSALLEGVLDSTTTPVLTLSWPDGTSIVPSVVNDSTGQYHADAAVPLTMGPGVAVRRWTATGGTPADDACTERRFIVDALDF